MKIITKLLSLSLMATVLTFTISCSDDDDCNDNKIIYNNQCFDKAYNKAEAQSYMNSVTKEFFSSSGIDTTELKPFISDCRYFNDTYLKYKSSDGESPFDSIVTNITKLASGDLSNLSSTLERYKRYAGAYTANTTTKAWEKTAENSNSIILNFNDAAGKTIQAKLLWAVKPSSVSEGTDNPDDDFVGPNVITVTDQVGTVVKDTLPNMLKLSITGGQHNLDFTAIAELKLYSSKYMSLNIGLVFKNYTLNLTKQLSNISEEKTFKLLKNGKLLVSSLGTTTGNNLLNYVVDAKSFPITERLSQSKISILGNTYVEMSENKVLYYQKLKALNASDVKRGSEEYAKQLVAIRKEANSSILYKKDTEGFIYIGSVGPQTYYNEDMKAWGFLPSITLNDKNTYYFKDLDDTGISTYLLMNFNELISRLSLLMGAN